MAGGRPEQRLVPERFWAAEGSVGTHPRRVTVDTELASVQQAELNLSMSLDNAAGLPARDSTEMEEK